MSPLQSTAPVTPAPGAKEYDPEIRDMADYIHNYKIDSDLAVRTFPYYHTPVVLLFLFF